MATPLPGWYTDPADASRHRYWDGDVWTEKTRPGGVNVGMSSPPFVTAEAKPERSTMRTVGIVAAVALGLAAIVGLGFALLRGDDDKTPGSSDSAVARDTSNTAGWDTFASRSGSTEYLVDPSWTDIYTLEDEEAMYGGTIVPGTAIELSGMWMHSGSVWSGGTVFVITTLDDGVGSLSLRLESEMFATEFSKTLDDYEELTSEAWSTAAGDEAWRLDFSGSTLGEALRASVITISHDTTVVLAYAVASDEFDAWIGDFLAMCDSLVVVHPPTNP